MKKINYVCDICGKENLDNWTGIIERDGELVIERRDLKISLDVEISVFLKQSSTIVENPVICKTCLAKLLISWANSHGPGYTEPVSN